MLLNRARSASADVVKALLAAVPPERLERLAAYTLEWLAGGDARLRRAACQVPFSLQPRRWSSSLSLKPELDNDIPKYEARCTCLLLLVCER